MRKPKQTEAAAAPEPALATSVPVATIAEPLQAPATSDDAQLTADAQRLVDLAMQGEVDRMQAMAQRIWDGQSVSLPNRVRKERIQAALIEQGFEPLFGYLRAPEGYESDL